MENPRYWKRSLLKKSLVDVNALLKIPKGADAFPMSARWWKNIQLIETDSLKK
jgi:hypothetical protein